MPLPRTAVIPGSVTWTGDSEGYGCGITSWLRPSTCFRSDVVAGLWKDFRIGVALEACSGAQGYQRGGGQQPVPRPTRSGHLLRGSGISAIRLLYLLPRCLLRWRRCRRRRRRRRRQETVTCPPPPPPPLVDEELQATSPFGHLLRDISLVRGAQARDFKSG